MPRSRSLAARPLRHPGAFEEIVGVEDACKYTNEYSSTGDVIGNVASNPNGIGYAPCPPWTTP